MVNAAGAPGLSFGENALRDKQYALSFTLAGNADHTTIL